MREKTITPERRAELLAIASAYSAKFGEIARRRRAYDDSRPAVSRTPLPPTSVAPLSSRELDVLQLIADGMTNRGVASSLHLSTHTINSHVRHINAKCRSQSRAGAVGYALRQHLIT